MNMNKYNKPEVIQFVDLAEGIYAASGSDDSTGITVTESGQQDWGGNAQQDFNVTIPSEYAGKHVIIVFEFNKELSGVWGGSGSVSRSGANATFDIWGVQESFTISAQAPSLPITCKPVSIKEA